MDFKSVMENPHSVGMPTFDEYAANPAHYISKFKMNDNAATLADMEDGAMNSVLGRVLKTVKHEILGYRVRTLEQVEKIALENGVDLRNIKYRACLIPLGGGDGEVLVKWMTEAEYNKRS